jgi:NTE family protein
MMLRPHISKFLVSFLLIIQISTQLQAAERPKIGIAFSGGGARGIAHIGVLQALEELKIPIDYIAGTSMGSIVGGLYASGLSSKELDNAVRQIDWESIFNLKNDRNQLSYREKQNQRRFFQLEFGLDKNYSLTSSAGLVGGQNLLLALKRLTRGVRLKSFSQLPIPFRAVATDINTAEPFVLKKGDLALTLRASMAVPFAFSPVEIDGHLLVDGGILNNLPVDVVRAMGADIVIAVNISMPLKEIKASSSFFTIASQSLDTALIQNTRRALEHADIIITPELKGYGFTDFSKGVEMISKGYEAIIKKSQLFQAFRLSATDYDSYRANVNAKKPPLPKKITPSFLKFTGNKRTSNKLLQKKLEGLIGKQLNIDQLEKETNSLMSLNDFEQITYDIIDNKQGDTGLSFDIREKRWGPNYFRFGLNTTTSFSDKAELITLLRHEQLNINRFGAEWITEIGMGAGYGFLTEFYQPLDYKRKYFIAPYANFSRIFTEIFENKQGIAEYDLKRFLLGLDIGMNFGNYAELRVGIQHKQLTANLRIGDPNKLPIGATEEELITLRFGYDTLDDRVFPRKGRRIKFASEIYNQSFGSESDYQKITLDMRQMFPLNNRLTLMTNASLFTFLHSTAPIYEAFSIGGLNYLAGYPEGDIGGKHALVLQFGGLYNPTNLLETTHKQGEVLSALGIRLVGLLHAGNAWDSYQDINMTDLLYGGLAGFVWDTPFGSVLLGTGYTKEGSLNYYLSLGNLF